jgi:hypothetical protein
MIASRSSRKKASKSGGFSIFPSLRERGVKHGYRSPDRAQRFTFIAFRLAAVCVGEADKSVQL